MKKKQDNKKNKTLKQTLIKTIILLVIIGIELFLLKDMHKPHRFQLNKCASAFNCVEKENDSSIMICDYYKEDGQISEEKVECLNPDYN